MRIVIGSVVDSATNSPLVGATVRMGSSTATTDVNGDYYLLGVRVGPNTIDISKSGYTSYRRSLDVVGAGAIPLDMGVIPLRRG